MVATTLSFFLIRASPVNPFTALLDNPRLSGEVRERLIAEYGQDRPVLEQFGRYVSRVYSGNLGFSFTHWRPVHTVVAERLPATLILMGLALAASFATGIAIGIAQARRAGAAADRVLGGITLFFFSLPDFWLALVLLYVFGYQLNLVPTGNVLGIDFPYLTWGEQLVLRVQQLVLPVLTLTLLTAALIARHQRGAVLDVARREFVRTARAKGASERLVLYRHILRNALLPVVTLLGLAVPALLTGAVFVERIFGINGMGALTVEAIRNGDAELVSSIVLLVAVMVSLGNLMADVLAALIDPRLREAA